MITVTTSSHVLLRVWVEFIQKTASSIVLASIALTLVASIYIIKNVQINTDTSSMLAHNLPFLQLSRELDTAFPQFLNNITIAIDSTTLQVADKAAMILADALRTESDLFSMVYDPLGDPFFRQNSLLYMQLNDLENLSDYIARAQPLLTLLYQDLSIRGLANILVYLIENSKEVDGISITQILRQVSTTVESFADERVPDLDWEKIIWNQNTTGTFRRILITQPILDFTMLHPAKKAISTIRDIAEVLNLTSSYGVQVRLTGAAVLDEEELTSVESSIGLVNGLSVVFTIVLLIMGLRSVRLVVLILITLLMGLVWTAALALLIVGNFNLISVAFTVLFVGLGVDFSIHLSLRYCEGLLQRKGALTWAITSVGGSLTVSAIGAASSFLSFLPTPYQGFAELGLISGTGMFIALIINLTVLPSLFIMIPMVCATKHTSYSTWLQLTIYYPRMFSIVALCFTIWSIVLLPWSRFDFDPLNLKNPESESVLTLRDLMRDHNPYKITILSESLLQAQILSEKIAKLPTVSSISTIFDYIPQNQEEKLYVIGDIVSFLSPLLAGQLSVLLPPTEEEIQKSLEELKKTLLDTHDSEAKRLQTAFERINLKNPLAISRLTNILFSKFQKWFEDFRTRLYVHPVAIEDLPLSIHAHETTVDGHVRIEVYPHDSSVSRDSLRRFITTVQTIIPRATGTSVNLYESGEAIIKSFCLATLLTIVVLLVFLAIILHSVRAIILAFIPLLFAVLLTNAVTILVGLSYNFANIITLPLLFGIGIANGVQFVLREHSEQTPLALLRTTTPRSVVLSAITTITSFTSLAFSSHPGTASMGLSLGLSVMITLVTTLFAIPALMTLVPRK